MPRQPTRGATVKLSVPTLPFSMASRQGLSTGSTGRLGSGSRSSRWCFGPSRLATGETLFFLVYDAEAVLPSELAFGSPRTSQFTESEQDDRRVEDVNFIEE